MCFCRFGCFCFIVFFEFGVSNSYRWFGMKGIWKWGFRRMVRYYYESFLDLEGLLGVLVVC